MKGYCAFYNKTVNKSSCLICSASNQKYTKCLYWREIYNKSKTF